MNFIFASLNPYPKLIAELIKHIIMEKSAFISLKSVFNSKFTVMNIAEAIEPVTLTEAQSICREKNFNYHLVNDNNPKELKVYVRETDTARPVYESELISESTSLLDVMELFNSADHFFVKSGHRITHIVTVSDLDKLPVRLFMFGILCLFELKIREIIRQRKIKWEDLISNEKLEEIKRRYENKREKDEETTLLDCTDFGSIVYVILGSKKDFAGYFPVNFFGNGKDEKLLKDAIRLRNAIAHGGIIEFDHQRVNEIIKLLKGVIEK